MTTDDPFTEAARAEAEDYARTPRMNVGTVRDRIAEAHLAGAEWARAQLTAQEPTDAEEEARWAVEHMHQFNGSQCVCGFESDRARSRTEHIMTHYFDELSAARQHEGEPMKHLTPEPRPLPVEDPTVDYHAMWWKAEREREQAERERDDLRAAMAELAPAEVCVRGDWFKVSELPEVLGCVMDARDEAKREAKRYYLRALTAAPVTPEWHNARIVEAHMIGDDDRYQWASTIDGMWVSLDGTNFATHRDYLHDVRIIVPGEVEV